MHFRIKTISAGYNLWMPFQKCEKKCIKQTSESTSLLVVKDTICLGVRGLSY